MRGMSRATSQSPAAFFSSTSEDMLSIDGVGEESLHHGAQRFVRGDPHVARAVLTHPLPKPVDQSAEPREIGLHAALVHGELHARRRFAVNETEVSLPVRLELAPAEDLYQTDVVT